MKDFSELKKNLKKDFSCLRTIKIAILGDTSTQFLTQALRGLGYDNGLNLEIWEADFDQIEKQVYDLSSELYETESEIVLIFQSSHKLLCKYNKLKPYQQTMFSSNELGAVENIYANLTNNRNTKVIYYNYTEIDDSVFGNYANKTESSFLFQIRKLNFELMVLASQKANLFLCDISSIQNQVGKSLFFQPSVYINTEMVLSIDVLPKVASKTIDLINTLNGKLKKCLILDLDNTIWGGSIGDDGIENIQIGNLGIGKAFSEFQYWVKKLKARGIIIAVCSKNSEVIAKEPFEKHPDMVLHLEDISVFIANWENKADNIRQIQSVLNISFDSMVFLDDNPFERNLVRENIPQICVPELPEDPAEYLEYLYNLNLFETVTFTTEDTERTNLYQIEVQRAIVQQKFTNEDDYLISLNMLSLVEPFNKFNTPRVAQLSQRSNQFNLRTIRYTDSDIENLGISEDHFTFAFTLEDKFGDSGLICVVVLKIENSDILFIENWFMSCRVLNRGMEDFVINTLVNFAKRNSFTVIKGEYIPTAKNEIVKNHYVSLDFEKQNGYWVLYLKQYKPRKNHISIKIINHGQK
ncbi:MAG: HAD-IIIC family phosphatase [Mariniphaga sp.]